MPSTKHILLTIDVEDWFQVENFKPWIPFETWDQRELRVERNVHRLLDLFDSCEVAGKPERLELPVRQSTTHNPQNTKNKSQAAAPSSIKQQTTYNKPTKKVRCTFFVLAWIAERLPNLVREILARGHEVASHGCNHQLPAQLSTNELKRDLINSKKLLEDISGTKVVGYRAPSFAINDHILQIIGDCGYRYDSSYNSFGLHGRYGRISLNGTGKLGVAHKLSDNFYELPVSNLKLAGQILPWGGGGYFRFLPLTMFNSGVKAILKQQAAYVFYVHPWELDPEQPKVNQASFSFKYRHYTNLKKAETRLKNLIKSFDYCRFVSCFEYLNSEQGS